MDRGVRGGSSLGSSEGPAEIVQVYEQDGFVRVRVLAMPTDPADLGRVLMDAAQVCAEVYRREEGASDARPYMDRILEGIEQEIEDPSGEVEDIREPTKN